VNVQALDIHPFTIILEPLICGAWEMPSFNILPIAPLVFDIPFIYKDDSRKAGFAH